MTTKKRTVTIDDKKYDFDSMSTAAKSQVDNIRITDAEIRQLKARLGIAQTARGVYAATLKAELNKGDAA